jgi:hypothetical protein
VLFSSLVKIEIKIVEKNAATILFYKYHDNILQNKQANMTYFYNEKIKCIHIYLLSFGGNYSFVPKEIPKLEYQ